MLPGYVPIVSHWYEVLLEKIVQEWLELLESFGSRVIVGSAGNDGLYSSMIIGCLLTN